jgi:ribonuclease HI
MLKTYSDGASRGNPGPSAIAFIILEDGKILKRSSRFVGKKTNNQAEYEAVVSVLEYASQLGHQEVACYMDSELVVKQLTGQYEVRNLELRKLWSKIQALKKKFRKISFVHVPRTNKYIQQVDMIVNQTLDTIGVMQ